MSRQTEARRTSAQKQLQQLFISWQRQQLQLRHFYAADSCHRAWLLAHPAADSAGEVVGFPNHREIRFTYADLNQDGRLDGLALFIPEQCDGGNGGMWSQEEVFFLSQKAKYVVFDTLQLDRFALAAVGENRFYQMDSIGPNRLYGSYLAFGLDAGHCCPDTNQAVVFDFAQRKLIYRGPNRAAQ